MTTSYRPSTWTTISCDHAGCGRSIGFAEEQSTASIGQGWSLGMRDFCPWHKPSPVSHPTPWASREESAFGCWQIIDPAGNLVTELGNTEESYLLARRIVDAVNKAATT